MQEHQVINKYRDICFSEGPAAEPALLTWDFTDLVQWAQVDIWIFLSSDPLFFYYKWLSSPGFKRII